MIDFKKINTDPINHITWDLIVIFITTIVITIVVGLILKKLKVPNFIIRPVVGVSSILIIYFIFKSIIN